jgi:hypothetical protein
MESRWGDRRSKSDSQANIEEFSVDSRLDRNDDGDAVSIQHRSTDATCGNLEIIRWPTRLLGIRSSPTPTAGNSMSC